jgi:peptide subunit release factor 1 (eRF1)/intein/homing endonuclease
MVQHLKLFKATPPHGLAAFSGNVAEREGQSDVKVWSFEPPEPLNIRIYRCDKQFVLEPLIEMCDIKEVYGLIVLDRRDANLALLRGKKIIPLVKTHSEVPGKFKAGGQCLTHDTCIQSADGEILQIKNANNQHILKSMDTAKFALRDSPIVDMWDVKKQEVITITTQYPQFHVQSSKDHIFFVYTEEGIKEKAAEDLRKGDILLMPECITVQSKNIPLFSDKYSNSYKLTGEGQKILQQTRRKKNLLQKELAKLVSVTQTIISSYELGKLDVDRTSLHMLCKALDIHTNDFIKKYASPKIAIVLPRYVDADFAQFLGYLVGDGTLETDRITFFEQRKDVAEAYKKKYENYFKIPCRYKFREAKNYYQLRFGSRPLVRMIQEEFPEIKHREKTIPKKITCSDTVVLAAFLRGLFDAEGYVSSRKNVSLGINNKILAHQIQMALLRLSIIASVHKYDNRRNPYSKNIRYIVDITEKKSLNLFAEHIGFTSSEKTRKLKEVCKKSAKSNVRKILVQGKDIRKIVENAGYNLQTFPKVTNFFRNERMMSKEVFNNSILSYVHDASLKKKLQNFLGYSLLPVKIKRVEMQKKETAMVDIAVKNQSFIANGLLVHNSAARFERNRELAAKDHFKKVADYAKDQFLPMLTNLKGILVGGPGPTKYDFLNYDYMNNDLKKKILGIKDLSYTEEFGLQELVDKSQDILAQEELADEKKIMNTFFELLKTKAGMVSYGEAEVKRLLAMAAVDTVLLSESLEDNTIEEFEEEAKKYGSTVKIISVDTREGQQLKEMGRVAALLRYEA